MSAPAVDHIRVTDALRRDAGRHAVYEALGAGRAVVQVDRIVNEEGEAAYRVSVLGVYVGLVYRLQGGWVASASDRTFRSRDAAVVALLTTPKR